MSEFGVVLGALVFGYALGRWGWRGAVVAALMRFAVQSEYTAVIEPVHTRPWSIVALSAVSTIPGYLLGLRASRLEEQSR